MLANANVWISERFAVEPESTNTYVKEGAERHLAGVALEVLVDDARDDEPGADGLRRAVRLDGGRNVDATNVGAT